MQTFNAAIQACSSGLPFIHRHAYRSFKTTMKTKHFVGAKTTNSFLKNFFHTQRSLSFIGPLSVFHFYRLWTW